MITEATYRIFRLMSEFSKHPRHSNSQHSSLNDVRMSMKYFESNLTYNWCKHASLGGMMAT
jgi:hypothetical protein